MNNNYKKKPGRPRKADRHEKMLAIRVGNPTFNKVHRYCLKHDLTKGQMVRMVLDQFFNQEAA